MDKQEVLQTLQVSQVYFHNGTACFTEEDSAFAPAGGVIPPGGRYTVCQHVAHVAHTVDWFMHPLKTGEPFNLDFETLDAEGRKITSLAAARQWIDKAYGAAVALIEEKDQAFLAGVLPDGPIMGGAPRHLVAGSIADHTAHHRGALAVYARLLGKEPAMPYGEF